MVDVASGIILLGLWGAWSLYDRFRDRPRLRRAIAAAIFGFSAVTVVIGVLLGMTGYNGNFEKFNPPSTPAWCGPCRSVRRRDADRAAPLRSAIR